MKFGLKKEDKIIKKEIEKKEFIELPETKNEEKVDKTPRVVNIKNEEYYDVNVGRQSIFGNPFIIGIHGNRDEVIDKFEEYLLSNPKLMEEVKTKLKGKVLGCSCSPLRCHGDILFKYANPELLKTNKPKL